MKFVLPGPETVTISGNNIEKLIRSGDGDAALLYLYVLKSRGGADLRGASEELARSEAEISASMSVLNRLGLVRWEESFPPEPDELPEYTAADIKREINVGSAFALLVQEVQRSLGKILASADLIKLFGIYDSLGLPPEVILQLITHCISESRRRYGGERIPTMRYIEKAAYTWEREGVFSLERAEEYLKNLELKRSIESEIKKSLQIKDRELTSTERKYIDEWVSMGFPADCIEIAYDRTLIKTGKLTWNYMDSIIKSWHGKNLHTTDEIHNKDGWKGASAQKADASSKKPDLSAPQTADVERMKRLLDKIKEG